MLEGRAEIPLQDKIHVTQQPYFILLIKSDHPLTIDKSRSTYRQSANRQVNVYS